MLPIAKIDYSGLIIQKFPQPYHGSLISFKMYSMWSNCKLVLATYEKVNM